jgi:hypothetical protein
LICKLSGAYGNAEQAFAGAGRRIKIAFSINVLVKEAFSFIGEAFVPVGEAFVPIREAFVSVGEVFVPGGTKASPLREKTNIS